MKIHILTAPEELRPERQPFRYPKHNRDFGVEQDFLAFLRSEHSLITPSPADADLHYLPVFWTRWHLNHDYGRTGLKRLQELVDATMIDDSRTFTVCQYDDGPVVNIGRTTVCYSSRNSPDGIDIPLLSSDHRIPRLFVPKKKWRASFVGRLNTHPLRQLMDDALKGREDVHIHDGDKGPRYFVRQTLASLIALAPRGYGGSSFRFFEAMQLGTVPLLIGDLDTRPFKTRIQWDAISLYVSEAGEIQNALDSQSPEVLAHMGDRAQDVYRKHISYGNWCSLLLEDLRQRINQ